MKSLFLTALVIGSLVAPAHADDVRTTIDSNGEVKMDYVINDGGGDATIISLDTGEVSFELSGTSGYDTRQGETE